MWACCSQTLLKQGEGPGWDLVVVLREYSQTPDKGDAQTWKEMGLPPQEQHCSLLPWKAGMKTRQGSWGMDRPSQQHPSNNLGVAGSGGLREWWIWPGKSACPPFLEPTTTQNFHKSCSSGQTCKIKQMGTARYNLEAAAQFFWGPKILKGLALCVGKQGWRWLVFLMWFPISAVALLCQRLPCITHDERLSQGLLNGHVFILWQDGNVANLWAAGGTGLTWDLFLAFAMRMVSLRAQQRSSLCCSRLRSPRVCQPGLWTRAVLSCLQKW